MSIPIESSPPPGWGPRGIDLLLDAFSAGRLSEIVGPWSSGGSSLLLALMARTTASGHHAALVDGADAFDPASAVSAGADLSRLLWVKCGGRLRAAFSAADSWSLSGLRARGARSGRSPVDPPGTHPAGALPSVADRRRAERYRPGASRAHRLAGSAAALAVSVRRLGSHWIGRPHPTRLEGLTSEALVVRSRALSIRDRESPGSSTGSSETHGMATLKPTATLIPWPL